MHALYQWQAQVYQNQCTKFRQAPVKSGEQNLLGDKSQEQGTEQRPKRAPWAVRYNRITQPAERVGRWLYTGYQRQINMHQNQNDIQMSKSYDIMSRFQIYRIKLH